MKIKKADPKHLSPKGDIKKFLWFLIYISVLAIVIFMGYVIWGASSELCFLSPLLGIFLVYVLHKIKEKVIYKKIDFDEVKAESSQDKYSQEDKYSQGDKYSQEYKYSQEKEAKKKSKVFSLFSREKRCDNCGTELEYKEAYYGYYCPECHEYK